MPNRVINARGLDDDISGLGQCSKIQKYRFDKGRRVMSKATIKEFLEAYKKYDPTNDYYHRYIDRAILWLFNRYPGHKSLEQVFAKISLVNRVYRANMERRKKEGEWKLAELLVENKFDDVITPLTRIPKFDSKALPEIVKVHSCFVTLAKKTIRIKATSFCSKYLHFHFPKIVPIYDSKSYETAWELVGKEVFINHSNAGDYEYFCLAILKLIEKLRRFEGVKNPNLKIIDHILYEKLRR